MKAQNLYSGEGHFERAMSDASPDRLAAQHIASELPSLAFMSLKGQEKEIRELRHDPRFAAFSPEQLRQMMVSEAMVNRDKFTFVSAALCGPLFLFGMGAAFALFDDIKMAREAKLQQMLSGKPGDTRGGIVAAVKGESLEETKRKSQSIIASDARVKPQPGVTAEGAKLLGLEKVKKADVQPRLEGGSAEKIADRVKNKLYGESERTWEEKGAQRSLKSWLKAEVLLKRKQSLMDHMESVRGKAGFGAYSGLAAKMDVLDKELKRLGL